MYGDNPFLVIVTNIVLITITMVWESKILITLKQEVKSRKLILGKQRVFYYLQENLLIVEI